MAKLQIPLLKTGNKFIDKAFAIACGDLAGNIGPYRSGLLKTEAPVIRAGLQYSAPWTRDASFNTWYAGALIAPETARNTLLSVLSERSGELLYKNVHGDKYQPIFEGGVNYFKL